MAVFGERVERIASADNGSYGLVRDDSGPVVIDNDATAIMAGLRRELDRIHLTHDSSCICVVSPDGGSAAQAMDGFGTRFATKLRSYDAIYRFAADKYLVMLPHISRGDAVGVIKRLRDQVIGQPFRVAGDQEVRVTASFGGTMLDSKALLHEHIDHASEAHEWALKGMGDSICFWAPQF
ncbi:MAG: diguanylate cyclase [Proteobacteria bacterium]|nr:diguanylate cyclase [Pseudomonadota bacterium]